jgi:hypothetical protein
LDVSHSQPGTILGTSWDYGGNEPKYAQIVALIPGSDTLRLRIRPQKSAKKTGQKRMPKIGLEPGFLGQIGRAFSGKIPTSRNPKNALKQVPNFFVKTSHPHSAQLLRNAQNKPKFAFS